MVRIRTVGRPETTRATEPAPRGPRSESARAEPSRALVALDGGRAEAPRAEPAPTSRGSGRPLAGFLAQMIVEADPTLRPSRLERTRAAAALYAEAGRRTA